MSDEITPPLEAADLSSIYEPVARVLRATIDPALPASVVEFRHGRRVIGRIVDVGVIAHSDESS